MKDLWEGPGGTLISMREAMRRLHFPKDAIYRLVAVGELEDFRYRAGGWHWIYLDSIESYLARHARRSERQKVARRLVSARAPKRFAQKIRRSGKR